MVLAPGTYSTEELTMLTMDERNVGHCLQNLVMMSFIDTNTLGCIASQVVLHLSLILLVLLSFVSSWPSCSNGFFRGDWENFLRETYE